MGVGYTPERRGGYKIPGRTKEVIRSSQGRRPSPFLLNKIHQDSVSLTEYITFAKIAGEREISLQTVTLAVQSHLGRGTDPDHRWRIE